MKRFFLVLFAALMITSVAMATTTCPNGGYDQYNPQNVGVLSGSITCATNNLSFSQFQFSSSASGGALLPTPASIDVTVLDTLGNEGFSFNPGFSVVSGQKQDATIEFAVTAAPGSTIDDLFIFFNGASTGTGSTNFSETYCTISFTQGCQVFSVPDAGNIDKHIDITPTTTLFITKDFVATGGTDGNASISKVVNQYSNVPEPSQFGMLLVGMGGLFFARRKFKASAQ